MRRNDLCLLDRYARARLAGEALPDLDLAPRPGAPPELTRVETPGGGRIQIDPSSDPTATCRREIRADRFGTLALEPVLWQGDLRGAGDGSPVFVRDMGPEENEEILAEWPDRTPYLWLPPDPGAEPRLTPYAERIQEIWTEG